MVTAMRLDAFLAEFGYADSRTQAKSFILEGYVTVDGKTVKKPSFEINEVSCDVHIDKSSKKFASRGGLKLEAALIQFNINPTGALALDIGASSGGFTDCLLKNGASRVIALDSGSGQMAQYIRDDMRVTVVENYNARYMKPSDFEYVPNLAVMDVSFISATYIIRSVAQCIASGADFVCLIKPQFEVGRSGLGKGGIVKSEKLRQEAVDKVVLFANSCGFQLKGIIPSPILGGDGNVEFLAHFVNGREEL